MATEVDDVASDWIGEDGGARRLLGSELEEVRELARLMRDDYEFAQVVRAAMDARGAARANGYHIDPRYKIDPDLQKAMDVGEKAYRAFCAVAELAERGEEHVLDKVIAEAATTEYRRAKLVREAEKHAAWLKNGSFPRPLILARWWDGEGGPEGDHDRTVAQSLIERAERLDSFFCRLDVDFVLGVLRRHVEPGSTPLIGAYRVAAICSARCGAFGCDGKDASALDDHTEMFRRACSREKKRKAKAL